MKNLIKLTFLALVFLFLGSCSSVKNSVFLKSSIDRTKTKFHTDQNKIHFKESDWKEHNLKGKVKKLIRQTQVINEQHISTGGGFYAAPGNYRILFDRRGDYIEKQKIKDGEILSRQIFTYNEEKNLAEEEHIYERPGKIVGSIHYYNLSRQKRRTEFAIKPLDYTNLTSIQYGYDSENRLISKNTFRYEFPESEVTLTYDSEGGSQAKTIIFGTMGGEMTRYYMNKEFDADGNIIRDLDYMKEDHKFYFTFEYEAYDHEGNWTQRRMFLNGEPIYLQNRTIEYYE